MNDSLVFFLSIAVLYLSSAGSETLSVLACLPDFFACLLVVQLGILYSGDVARHLLFLARDLGRVVGFGGTGGGHEGATLLGENAAFDIY